MENANVLPQNDIIRDKIQDIRDSSIAVFVVDVCFTLSRSINSFIFFEVHVIIWHFLFHDMYTHMLVCATVTVSDLCWWAFLKNNRVVFHMFDGNETNRIKL